MSLATEVFRIAKSNKIEAIKYLRNDCACDILLDLRECKLIVDSMSQDTSWRLVTKADRLYVQFDIKGRSV